MAVDFERDLLMGVAKETTYNTWVAGTGAGTAGYRLLPGARLATEQDVTEAQGSRQQAAPSPYDIAAGLRRWTFDCEMNLPKEALAVLLFNNFGTITTSGPITTTHYKHINHIKNGTPSSVSLTLHDDNREWQLSGGALNRLVVSFPISGYCKAQCQFIGGKYVDAAAGTTSAPTYTVPSSGNHFYKTSDFTITVNAVSWAPESMEFTFERTYAEGAAESYQGSSTERTRLESASADGPAFMVTGTTRRIYDGITQFDLMDAFTQFAVVATAGTIDADGYATKFDFQKCQALDWAKEGSGGIVMQRLGFKAYYTAASDIVVTTQDTLATPATG